MATSIHRFLDHSLFVLIVWLPQRDMKLAHVYFDVVFLKNQSQNRNFIQAKEGMDLKPQGELMRPHDWNQQYAK